MNRALHVIYIFFWGGGLHEKNVSVYAYKALAAIKVCLYTKNDLCCFDRRHRYRIAKFCTTSRDVAPNTTACALCQYPFKGYLRHLLCRVTRIGRQLIRLLLIWSHDVARCRTMSHDVARCCMMSHDVARCRTVSHDVARCRTITRDVARQGFHCSCKQAFK
jgi:hypothetical protein